ncbi:MAG: hypothetical protein SGJ07_06845 [Rhodospirillaceae bacterium]|nr:hypothetical protein [Rhodospirillaceae bacterium]
MKAISEGGFEIEMVGEIARMVAMAADPGKTKAASGKEAAFSSEFARSVKLVAGARNRLHLLVEATGISIGTDQP